MKLNRIAESYFQNSLAKFCPRRKPDDKGFTSTGYEREMFKMGVEWFIKEAESHLWNEVKWYVPNIDMSEFLKQTFDYLTEEE